MPALLVLAAAIAFAATAGAGRALSTSSIPLVAVDTDPSGNDPRTVGSIEQCVSARVGQPVEIDIVVPSPGIPAQRGIAAFQLRLFYDPAIVWVTDDDSAQLLAEAAGSQVIAFSDVAISGAPNKSGDYLSLAADFGPKGIEPDGASETGPGVLARVTLLSQGEGTSPLILTDVEIADDDSQRIPVDSVQSATIAVGEPCAAEGVTLDSSLAMDSSPTPTPMSAADTQAPALTPTPPATPTLTDFSATGGPPPPTGNISLWLIGIGLATSLGGAALIALRWALPRRGGDGG